MVKKATTLLLRKIPTAVARLTEPPIGNQVVNVSAPNRQRRLDTLQLNRCRNFRLSRLDGGAACQPRDLLMASNQLDLLAPVENGRVLV